MPQQQAGAEKRKRLGLILTVAMVFAMLMGPGPGLRLINPDINDPNATYIVGGIPIVYAWGLFWFAVQVAIVMIAYFSLWRHDDAVEAEG
ncbi:MAG: hypothetical protein R2834_17055 [Rhodothermales bacterium]